MAESMDIDVDYRYEFCAPMFYDFRYEETDADIAAAERWFDSALPYEASPHVAKTKSIPELCSAAFNFGLGGNLEAQQILAHVSPKPESRMPVEEMDYLSRECEQTTAPDGTSVPSFAASVSGTEEEPCTPECRIVPGAAGVADVNRTPPTGLAALVVSPGSLPAKRLYSEAWREAPLPREPQSGSKHRLSNSNSRIAERNASTKREGAVIAGSILDTQAQKKQKLEGGLSSKIMRPPSPFVSMAERVRRFQNKTPERFYSHRTRTTNQEETHLADKPKMQLTMPKEFELETSQRSRPTRMKSTAELEEEMLANIPKFKARPLPKKILEAPALPTFTRSTPQMPEFQVFHLHTMERAQQHADIVETTSYKSQLVLQERVKPTCKLASNRTLTAPQPPHLETANRARASTVKSREEMEEEELAQIPKFKARPLNKRIFHSKGDLGVFRIPKREVTTPQEFHFKTDERAHLRGAAPPTDQLLKLTVHQQPNHQEGRVRLTKPKPFHLLTDDRGLAKEMKFIHDMVQRQQEEEKARIPKANPLPYTTDYPEVPLKPEPKECTKAEPFQLESLVRHQEEQQRQAEERAKAEQIEAALKEFHACPNLSNAPAFIPVKSRKPLTEVQEFNFHVDHRAVERAEFDLQVMEKHNQYKRFREEVEAFRKEEEKQFIKSMRREMVPIAQPMPEYPQPPMPLRSSKQPTIPASPQFTHKLSHKERQQAITNVQGFPMR
ncbi:unnamed protein product [Sphagnum jensenii]|uniref:Targeting protein for Xklp2 n=1 Tax=Sphagnum jensenii TaxID=128206 RepID=A0ABP0VM79_9BRYO